MNDDGKNANVLIKQMNRLYAEISSLLQTADKLMLREHWQSKSGSTAVQWSNQIACSNQWIPQDIFRFYSKNDSEHILAYIAVILFDRDDDDKLSEPLLSGGWLDYGKGNKITDWEYWYAHLHVYQEKFENDGQIRPICKNLFNDDLLKRKILAAHSLAVPLMDITSSTLLESKIARPLIDGIETSK